MRYFMLGPGSRDARGTAFMPGLPVTAKASSYRAVKIDGQPGTRPIPSPRPVAIPPSAMVRTNQPSNVSPDVFFPAIYTPYADNMHPPVGLGRHNEMPVPAVDLYKFPRNPSYGAPFAGRSAGVRMTRRRIAGRRALRWPAAPQVFDR